MNANKNECENGDWWQRNATAQITCERGLSAYLAAELTELGFSPKREHRTGVEISATFAQCADICLRSRIAYSVLWEIAEWKIENAEQLYRAAVNFAWENYLRVDTDLTLDCRVQTATVNDTRYPALKLKDAIVDRLRNVHGSRPNSNGDRRGAVVRLNWQDSRAWVFLDASGNKLSDRGYRKIPLSAPLRENLAAAILRATEYDGSQTLINPMCGSGTLAIEAALIARNAAPGLLRDAYAFQHLCGFNAENYHATRTELNRQKRDATMPIIANDRDVEALAAAKKNAATAGVENLLTFHHGDFFDTPRPENLDGAAVIFNPPYNERLDADAAIYKNIGDFLKQKCRGATGWIFTGNRELAKSVGLKPSRRLEFFNGKIDCRLLKFPLY